MTVQIVGGHRRYDEITAFEEASYVSASEAVWLLLQFDLIEQHDTVVRLDVHMEDHRTVNFRENNEQIDVNRRNPGKKLTEWFNANGKWPEASHMSYHDFPQYFTWNAPKERVDSKSKVREKQRI